MNLDLGTVAQLVSTFTVVAGLGFIFAVYQVPEHPAAASRRDRAHPHPHDDAAGGLRHDGHVPADMRMIPLGLVDDLLGGLIRQAWRKLRTWLADTRTLGNPNAFEWFEWLNAQLEAHHAPTKRPPASVLHRDWRP